ncbi:PREDICTED: protein tramtrack, beta isoform-like [Rhagoletis zephyria]|uniref:protein tramtrack, beta isoform-like n=1 Tax=Rhagoletis zephyria TaxID=28612 RepID=UPI0008118E6F|nr:PREDICTED: protein tramtrack, beta isoform-like [Rhagoletis zephyria]
MAAALGGGNSNPASLQQQQQQQYCLKWNSFHNNMSELFQTMLIHENLVDVTLACEGQSIKTHKMILAACSNYFLTLFTTNPCKHPIVILKDVKFNDLKAIIDFIYSGEVNIPQEQLNSLLKTAETLKIKGLSEFGAEKQVPSASTGVSLKNSLNTAIPVNYGTNSSQLYAAFGKKRKRPRLQFSGALSAQGGVGGGLPNSSAINLNHINNSVNSGVKTYAKSMVNSLNSLQQQQQQQVKAELAATNGDTGDTSDEEDEETPSAGAGGVNLLANSNSNNNSSKSLSYTNSPSYKALAAVNNSSTSSSNNNNNNNIAEHENERDEEEFEPTKLLEQSMSTPENTGVDYSPENNNDGQVQSGDEEEGEDNSKGFLMDDEYSSNNSNNDSVSVMPVNSFANQFVSVNSSANSNSSVNGGASSRGGSASGGGGGGTSIEGIREYEQLLAEIQQKNLTICPICSKEFIKKSKLIRHYHTHFSDFRPKFSCVFCGKLFTTQDWCKRHALNCQLKQYQHISHLDLYNE